MELSLTLGLLVTESIVKMTKGECLPKGNLQTCSLAIFLAWPQKHAFAETCRPWFLRIPGRNKMHVSITKRIRVSSNELFPGAKKMGHHQFLSVCATGQAPIWFLQVLHSQKATNCSGQVPRTRGHCCPPRSHRKGQGKAVCDHSPLCYELGACSPFVTVAI